MKVKRVSMSVLFFNSKRPKIGKDCFLASSSMVIGDVEIGSCSSIWFGTVIRGDVFHIRIGNEKQTFRIIASYMLLAIKIQL